MSRTDSLTVNQQGHRQISVSQMTDKNDETWFPTEMSITRSGLLWQTVPRLRCSQRKCMVTESWSTGWQHQHCRRIDSAQKV